MTGAVPSGIDEISLPLQSWDRDFDGDGLSPYGEDTNANGTLDAGEDANGNGKLDNGDADDQDYGGAFNNFTQQFKQNQFGTVAERGNAALIAAKSQAYRYFVFADRRVSGNGNLQGVSVGSSVEILMREEEKRHGGMAGFGRGHRNRRLTTAGNAGTSSSRDRSSLTQSTLALNGSFPVAAESPTGATATANLQPEAELQARNSPGG